MDEKTLKEIANIIGHRLLLLRINNKLDQAQMAKKIGCTQRDVSQWERGKKLVSTKFMFSICAEFGLNFDYFDPRKKGPEDAINNNGQNFFQRRLQLVNA